MRCSLVRIRTHERAVAPGRERSDRVVGAGSVGGYGQVDARPRELAPPYSRGLPRAGPPSHPLALRVVSLRPAGRAGVRAGRRDGAQSRQASRRGGDSRSRLSVGSPRLARSGTGGHTASSAGACRARGSRPRCHDRAATSMAGKQALAGRASAGRGSGVLHAPAGGLASAKHLRWSGSLASAPRVSASTSWRPRSRVFGTGASMQRW